ELSPHYGRFDINGDGRDDLIAYYGFGLCPLNCSAAQIALLAGDNYQFWPIASVPHMSYPAIGPINLNGDHCWDLGVDADAYISKCSSGLVLSTDMAGSYVGRSDWNGDTRGDAFVSVSGSLHVQVADGEGLQS